jgi:putative ABC transport system substrate-binding protein
MRLIGLAVVLALSLALAPHVAEAQQVGKVYRVGVLRIDSPRQPYTSRYIEDLRQGLRDLGYVEGQNLVVEVRWAEGRPERLPELAAELVRLNADVIVTSGPQATDAARQATSVIPIVIGRMDDVDARGFVANLARPGGNITGLSFQTGELSGKWVQLLKEALPRLSRLAVLWDPTGSAIQLRTTREAAGSLGLHVQILEARGPADFDQVFAAAKREKAEALVILGSPILTAAVQRLAELAARAQLPAIYYNRAFATAGGVMTYGPKESDFGYQRAAVFVDKILKGAKPADLPVEQPTKFELVINLKTARALGLTLPQSLLVRADEVIE